ncbi:hypothetical protein LOTGIDRAFT_157068 [Lottia gigantea]|uniref:Fucolectin tachylectin-4 pentraxin-1 domain-containing protein n=1 Tax=Lottia gigantea TaxID=225164 RepID=V4AWS1_LOTGI|nr:hypothetical protein LOTGIDRAFT_157068 [Lottia gigantea]ESP01938.1 hypothetical protein LOTGIDRAFT_157068 [Lottia gigantea]
MLCFTNISCVGFGYHEQRLECFLYDMFPVECQGVVNDIGMEIYVPSEEDKTNVAIGKPSVMSTFHSLPYLPCNCVDGNTANDRLTVCHTQKLNPNWFCVDLENIYNFKQITIFNRQDGGSINRIVNFQIRLSSVGACDESTFSSTPLCHQDPNPTGLVVYNITTCSGAVAFSSRYIFISNSNGQFLTFSEIKVHAL